MGGAEENTTHGTDSRRDKLQLCRVLLCQALPQSAGSPHSVHLTCHSCSLREETSQPVLNVLYLNKLQIYHIIHTGMAIH